MISRATALASAMSLPTSRPSHTSAHSALDVRRGSTAYSRAPRRTPAQEVVEEDRMRLAGVAAPEDDQIGLLGLTV